MRSVETISEEQLILDLLKYLTDLRNEYCRVVPYDIQDDFLLAQVNKLITTSNLIQ